MNTATHPGISLRLSGAIRLVLLMMLVALLAACGKEEKEVALSSGSVVLALGDSLTAGA